MRTRVLSCRVGGGDARIGDRVSKKPSPSFSTLIGMGVATALCIAVGVGGGYWLDRTFHTGVLLTFVGLALGVVAAVVVVYSNVKMFL